MKDQIGELLIGENGTLSLEIYELEINGKKIDIKEKMTKEDSEELSDALTKMNEIIIGKINEIIRETEKEEENKKGENE
jgi:hypothetical protein